MPRQETFEKPLPSSPETERAVLGAIVLDNTLISEAVLLLSPEDFYTPSHRRIFVAMIAAFERGSEINPIILADDLRRDNSLEVCGGVMFLTNLTYGLPHVTSVKSFAEIVKSKSNFRWIVKEGARLTAAGLDESEDAQDIFTSATERFSAMREKSVNGHSGGQLIELAREVTDHLYTIRAGINTAVPTGLADLDRLTAGGIRPGELWGIAARSSRGKSSVLVQILLNMAKAGHPVVLFSLETQALSVALRILSAETGVAMNSLRAPGALREAEIDELVNTIEKRFDLPLWIYTKGYKSIVEIKRKIHSLNKTIKGGRRVAAVGIDWYGKLNAGDNTRFRGQRTQELKHIADSLQDIAIEEEVGLIVPAQFNRSGWSTNDPGPGNIDGGEAYHDACDLFAVLNTEPSIVASPQGKKMSKAKLTVFKQRNGPVALGKDALKLMFDRNRMQFFPRLEDAGEEVPDPVSPKGYIPSEKERAEFL